MVSRRGIEEAKNIDLMLVHPELGLTPEPLPLNTRKRTTKVQNAGTTFERKILHDYLIDPLTQRHVIVGTLRSHVYMWYGVARVPQVNDDGTFESRSSREAALRNRSGDFRILGIRCAP